METLFDQPLALGEVRIERKYDPTNPDRCIYRIQKDAVYVCIHPDAYGRVVSERCLDVGASCPIPGKLKKEGKQA